MYMRIAVGNANEGEAAILLTDKLKALKGGNAKHFRVEHVLSRPSDGWEVGN